MNHREFPEAEGAKFQCKWYCTLDRLSVLEPDFSALSSTNAFSGEFSGFFLYAYNYNGSS